MHPSLSHPRYLASVCVLSMIFGDTPSPSLLFFSSFQWKNRCSSIPDYFYLTMHYHNKTRAWKKKKKDKLKETARPRTWIWEAYFHLSSLSLFFYVALFFSLREMESDMPFHSPCASLWCFSGLLLCMGRAQSRAQAQRRAAGGLPGAPRQTFHRATKRSAANAPAKWALNALMSVAKEPCQD